MAESNILVKRDVQLPGNILTNPGGEVLDKMPALGSGDYTPVPFIQFTSDNLGNERRDIVGKEIYHTVISLDVSQRPAIKRFLPDGDEEHIATLSKAHTSREVAARFDRLIPRLSFLDGKYILVFRFLANIDLRQIERTRQVRDDDVIQELVHVK